MRGSAIASATLFIGVTCLLLLFGFGLLTALERTVGCELRRIVAGAECR